jgi:phosphatidylethanolamine/phosphatidyl-N-methylethanolamine N-methyltransferase
MTPRKCKTAASPLKMQVSEHLRFLRNWAERPLVVGAVAPSSPELARRMAGYIDLSAGQSVVELGPGTGVVTGAILARGVAPERLVAIEYSGDFHARLCRQMPTVTFLHGDAFRLRDLVAERVETPLAAVVSSLPLFTKPLSDRLRLIRDAFDLMAPGAPFIQFSYALVPPIPPEAVGAVVERSPWILGNLPPARVWVYRRPA